MPRHFLCQCHTEGGRLAAQQFRPGSHQQKCLTDIQPITADPPGIQLTDETVDLICQEITPVVSLHRKARGKMSKKHEKE